MSDPVVLATGFDSPEGPAFDREGNLFFVNWLSHQILKMNEAGLITEFYNTGGIPAGLAFHPDGSLWVADEGEEIHGLLRITPDGEATIAINAYDGKPLNGANDLVFDAHGTVYFSDPWGSSAENPNGGFYRYFADGRLEQIDHGLAFPNGVALNSNDSLVYLAETFTNSILRYELLADGTIGPREYWAKLESPFGPDGMAFDADGVLHVAHYGGSRIDRFDSHGQLLEPIAVPGAGVTNCAFGGADGQTLVVTCVTSASVYAFDVPTAGQALNDGIFRDW